MTTHLFLFPHQDDEFGVFHLIETLLATGQRPICMFLTNGGQVLHDNRRDAESTRVLLRLGVNAKDIHFLGSRCGFPDGNFVSHLFLAFDSVMTSLSAIGKIDAIYLPAWEGGHQDHDAAHVLGLALAGRCDIFSVYQFSLYNGCRAWPFQVLSPIPENGPVKSSRIDVKRRLAYLGLCLSYRSQIKSWIALLPFVAARYVFDGQQKLQGVSSCRIHERPHYSKLLYERRKKTTFAEFSNQANRFISAHATDIACVPDSLTERT